MLSLARCLRFAITRVQRVSLATLSPPPCSLAATATLQKREAIKQVLGFGPTDSKEKPTAALPLKSYELVLPIFRNNIEISLLLRTNMKSNLQFLIDERIDEASGKRLAKYSLPEGVGLTLIYVTQCRVADKIKDMLEAGGLLVDVYYKRGRTKMQNEDAMKAYMEGNVPIMGLTPRP